LSYLLEAFQLLMAAGADASLLLIGDGKDEARYRSVAAQMPNVVFCGFIQKRDLPLYYAAADVFVFPTLGDPHGLAIDEAMAAGLPVITSSAAGEVEDRVPNGEAGLVVPPADSKALLLAMITLLENQGLRATMSITAANLARQRSPEKYAEDFERLVFRLLDMPNRRTFANAVSTLGGKLVKACLADSR
jgi:glycosyltransferase involved in cell wall biosynthesis